MRRLSVILFILVAVPLTGCRAPRPTFDPFAPYGPKRIPPPPTGSINPYYTPGANTGSGQYQPNPSLPAPGPTLDNGTTDNGTTDNGTTNRGTTNSGTTYGQPSTNLSTPGSASNWRPQGESINTVQATLAPSDITGDPVQDAESDNLRWRASEESAGGRVRVASTDRPTNSRAVGQSSPPEPFRANGNITPLRPNVPNNFRPLAVRPIGTPGQRPGSDEKSSKSNVSDVGSSNANRVNATDDTSVRVAGHSKRFPSSTESQLQPSSELEWRAPRRISTAPSVPD